MTSGTSEVGGIHHVTAIGGPARATAAFHRGALGLALVKDTVNHDEPTTRHLYFGDAAGRPGSVLTFFSHEGAAPGRPGAGEAVESLLALPRGALEERAARLRAAGAAVGAPVERFGRALLPFRDADGTALALTEDDDADAPARFLGVTLAVRDPGATAAVLLGALGYAEGPREAGAEGERRRLLAPDGGHVDLLAREGPRGRPGRGTVHHVAFRCADGAAQAAVAAALRQEHGIEATPVLDRTYFRSVYFREPGGVLFEVATDGPGFAADEPADRLGSRLALPARLEGRRASIEAALGPLT